jgi:hypothetical protein
MIEIFTILNTLFLLISVTIRGSFCTSLIFTRCPLFFFLRQHQSKIFMVIQETIIIHVSSIETTLQLLDPNAHVSASQGFLHLIETEFMVQILIQGNELPPVALPAPG